MLTDPSNLPAVSTTPLPAGYFDKSEADLYSLYAAGLTAKFASDCAPPPLSFDFGPSPMFTVVPNVASPALSSASSAYSPISPFVKTVQEQQSGLASMLVNRSQILANVVNSAGGQGAVYQPSDFADAAEVLPMGPTNSQSVNPAVLGGANGWTGNKRLALARRKQAGNSFSQPSPPWGGVPQRLQGGCQSIQSNGWGKLLLFAGLGIIVLAVVND